MHMWSEWKRFLLEEDGIGVVEILCDQSSTNAS